MNQGTIKKIIEDRGFGFIAQRDGDDLFFHYRDLDGLEFNEQLTERRVRFNVIDTGRGPRAVNVRPAD